MQKRRILSSSLLVGLMVWTVTGSVSAQTLSVTPPSVSSQRCTTGSLNVALSIPSSISALEVVLDYSGDAVINGVIVSVPGVALATTGVDLLTPGKIRFWALDLTGGTGCLSAGAYPVVATISYTTNDVCSGSLVISGGTFICPSPNNTAHQTQVVDCLTSAITPVTVTGSTITISNNPPSITCPLDQTMHWGQVLVVTATATDTDPVACESLTYSLTATSPGYASVAPSGPNAGKVTLAPTGGDVCVSTVGVIVTDECGAKDTCTFAVCVQNTPPVATCPTLPNRICWGEAATGQVTASDPDGGPVALNYTLNSFDGPGTMVITPSTGAYTWQTQETPNFISPPGGWTLCVKVSDGANVCDPCSPSNADTCCLKIIVIQTERLTIEKLHDVIQGGPADVEITLDSSYPNYPFAGFDFLLEYDASALTLLGVSEGGFITGNAWEYFTYRFGPNGNCAGACPSGKVRIVALAEQNNGAAHPDGYTNTSAGSSVLAILHFLVSDDRTLECQYAPIRWCWIDCGDNTLSSVSGDTLFISRYIYDLEGTFGDGGASSIDDPNVGFPTNLGAQAICDVDPDGTGPKLPPMRKVDFKNGGVDIVCAESIDARGDINLNGISNEIADAVVFTNYFVEGLGAFNINIDGQTAATEVNGDGLVLTVADLVYLIRVIVGDALPLPKLSHNAATALVTTTGELVSVDQELGAALFVFRGPAEVTLVQSGLAMKTGLRDGNTYAVVYPDFTAGSARNVVITPGAVVSSNATLVSAEVADYYGQSMSVATKIVPTTFAVRQNYPNPFNPSTKISFDLPVASEYVIAIYNVAGQRVDEIKGYAEAGSVEREWNAVGMASGVYFYTFKAGDFVTTKKMSLLK